MELRYIYQLHTDESKAPEIVKSSHSIALQLITFRIVIHALVVVLAAVSLPLARREQRSPFMGASIALHHGNEPVFLCSVLLIIIDLVYIAFFLPESLGAGEEEEEVVELGGGGLKGKGRSAQRERVSIKRRKSPSSYDDFLAVQVGKLRSLAGTRGRAKCSASARIVFFRAFHLTCSLTIIKKKMEGICVPGPVVYPAWRTRRKCSDSLSLLDAGNPSFAVVYH